MRSGSGLWANPAQSCGKNGRVGLELSGRRGSAQRMALVPNSESSCCRSRVENLFPNQETMVLERIILTEGLLVDGKKGKVRGPLALTVILGISPQLASVIYP